MTCRIRTMAMAVAMAVVMTGVAGGAYAGSPVVIVEDVSAPGAGVSFMEYLTTGRIITLGVRDTLILGYLRSCMRETITGGSVTIGADESVVQGGKVARERVECDGGSLQLTVNQAR